MHDQLQLACELGADNLRILDPGRYWADVFPGAMTGAWRAFLTVNAGSVIVEHTEEDEEGIFVIFRTTKPLVYPTDMQLPEPNKALANVKEKRDTVQRPDLPKDITDDLPDVGGTVTKVAICAVICLAIFAGLSAARR